LDGGGGSQVSQLCSQSDGKSLGRLSSQMTFKMITQHAIKNATRLNWLSRAPAK
jgi:serine/threonine protein phosphatase PrpC